MITLHITPVKTVKAKRTR